MGRVRRAAPGRSTYIGKILSPATAKRGGYHQVVLCNGNKKEKRTLLVPWLVCLAFHGPKPTPEHDVAHNNGNPKDDRSDNLRWATAQENSDDKYIHGTMPLGSEHWKARFTEADVVQIRQLAAQGLTGVQISAHMGIPVGSIRSIIGGKGWVQVGGPIFPDRKSRFVTIGNETHSVAEWCRKLSISPSSIYKRMRKNGMAVEEAIASPKTNSTSMRFSGKQDIYR